ncbi:MAG: glycosyltransferase family 39 protein [Armatimonadota bacterium]|nr:glycosyltransferase family 39 protein [Armatimonadota bacterium]MDW8105135.1 glycosyltransferase family 39 protein [Armatimonadota bacterium]MDW8290499.1 glycosyltransferase family 39 protein [Armatimonadota bacterium]
MSRKRRAKTKAAAQEQQALPPGMLWAIVAVFVVLSLLFNFRTPVGRNGYFHTPDEGAHLAYVRYVAEEGKLPRFEGYAGVGYEAHQPPLYYLLAAQIWKVGEWLPVPPARAVRMLSTLLGVLLVLTTYRLARTLLPEMPAVAAVSAGAIAFLPMHVALCSAVNNDSLTNLLFALVLLEFALLYTQTKPSRWIALRMGLWAGLAGWTKVTSLLLLPTIVVGWLLVPRRSGIHLWRGMLVSVGLATALILPWGIRNLQLYDDPLLLKAFEQTFAVTARAEQFLQRGTSLTEYLQLVAGWTYRSFWFAYGTPQTAASGLPNFLPERVYLLLGGVHLLSLAGFALALWRERDLLGEATYRWYALAGVLTLLVVGAFVRFILTYFQTQGRYLYPALVPLQLTLALGWRSLFPAHFRGVADGLLLLVLLAICILAVSVI